MQNISFIALLNMQLYGFPGVCKISMQNSMLSEKIKESPRTTTQSLALDKQAGQLQCGYLKSLGINK
jgi:hypothetical protein